MGKLFCFFSLLILNTFGQEPPVALYPISNIDWKSESQQKFSFIDTILQKKNILILSEISHGDGASYDAQCSILKNLLDSNKINIIYTESNWLNIDKICEVLAKEGESAIRKSYKYMRSTELKYWVDNGFWDYLAKKIIKNKVQLKGLDIDGTSSSIVKQMFNEAVNLPCIISYIKKYPKEYKILKNDYDIFEGWGLKSLYETGYNEQKKFINLILNAYNQTGDAYKIKQWTTLLNFYYWMSVRTILLKKNEYANIIESDKQMLLFHSVRDSLMAEIFINDYNLHKNFKSVILVSAYHSIKNIYTIKSINECCYDPHVNIMGDILNRKFSKKIYTICFITASGQRAINYYSLGLVEQVKKPQKNSLEYILNKRKIKYCFVDLTDSLLMNSTFYMNAIFDKYLLANWGANFSGIFFIKEMYPLNFKNPSVLLSKEEQQ